MTAALVLSLSVDNLLSQRDALIERVTKAHALLNEADAIGKVAFQDWTGHEVDMRLSSDYGYFNDERGLEKVTRKVDAAAWSHLLHVSGLRTFLNAEARKKWDTDLDKGLFPPLTRDNIEATFQGLYAQRGEFFDEGVISVFRKLNYDYVTNSPRMFGKRLVLRFIVDCWMGKAHPRPRQEGCDGLDDLIRVMSVLDGKPEPDHREGAYRRLCALKWPEETPVADLHGLFTLRGFKNGNAHLTFSRPDLTERLNLILAKHFPGCLPAHQEG